VGHDIIIVILCMGVILILGVILKYVVGCGFELAHTIKLC